MSNNISKKHHFIPEFYLKGFANENDDIYLYDLIYKKINPMPKKASQIFYKEHFHTVTELGQKSVLIEDFYGDLEGLFSQVIKQLKECPRESFSEIFKIEDFCKVIVLMISIQYWRNPINTDYAKQCSNDLLKFFDRTIEINGKIIPFDRKDVKYFHKKRNNETHQKFIQFFILPLITFRFCPLQLQGLYIHKFNDDEKLICSDNPVMIDSLDADFKFQGEFLYPLNQNFAITNTEFNSIKDISVKILSNANKKIIASSVKSIELLTKA